MKMIITVMLVVGALLLGAVGFAYSGIYDVSAASPHSGLADWFLSRTSDASIERRAGSVEVPDLDNAAMILAGVNDFDSMCTSCHGAPGKNPEAMGQGLNPSPPDLAEEAAELSAAELFWITKNGIKMTGMPAWGVTHDDDAIWPMVAFMKQCLPELDAPGYQEMLAAAAGHGHHEHDNAAEHAHEEPAETGEHVEHDHGDHEHDEH